MESVDPRTMHVLIRDKDAPNWLDCTWKVAQARRDGDRIVVTYANGKEYPYGTDRVRLYDQVERRELDALDEVVVSGQRWNSVESIWTLRCAEQPRNPRYTLAYRKADGTLALRRYASDEVRVRLATPEQRKNAATLDYVRDEVRAQAQRAGAMLDTSGRYARWVGEGEAAPAAILANVWEWLPQAPRGSALEAFLAGSASAATGASDAVVMPFHSNLDQRNAIRAALTHQISIIDGPPGTGKTQTILNLIASLIAQGKTIGVVAGANSAVDNVIDKLTEEGYGFLVASLGKTERVQEFHRREGILEQRREAWAQKASTASPGAPARVDEAALRAEEERLVALWEDARDIPAIRARLTATQRERLLFEEKVKESRRPMANISHLAVVRRSSETIADLLALARCAPRPGRSPRAIIERVRRYFAYGSLKGIDLGAPDVQSALQLAFYQARERELSRRVEEAEVRAARHGLVEVSATYRRRSREALDGALLDRFERERPSRLSPNEWLNRQTGILLRTYPVVASTCFSIRHNLAEDTLLDWIIIDESSQVLLPEGMAALSKARNAVIVGDARQIGPIFQGWDESTRQPPEARFDVRSVSLLDSVKAMGKAAHSPTTLLREHYRCHPAIIEFCNRMYYGGQLIPMRVPAQDAPDPLAIVYAAPGNHARRPLRGGGFFSQREIEIISQLEEMEVIREGIEADDKDSSGDFVLGIVTPYRAQATSLRQRIRSDLGEGTHARWLAETAHKFQGRGAGTVVLSTVLNARDRAAAREFYDSDAMTNVIVSRAKDRFIVVTTHGGVRLSRNIRTLLDYIEMYDPSAVVQSDIVSIFDVLYNAYSASLERYSRAKWADHRRSPAENVADQCLREILAEPAYSRFGYQIEVFLKDALPNTRRLSEEQRAFVFTDSALDFGVYSRVTGRLVLAIEVDGWQYHGASDTQRKRDALKDSIMAAYDVPVLRLPTNGSGEERRIREALDKLL
ncbi:AAA domain-containing protein [uncultured Actinomyces sp.]|uniref:AAA domain-containing protein n=1 Tax=uncultured Actinomyces sp. TaxID=249061 RepID=UPI002635D09B|nr:AAA domain-containing protein [uncultured Actinomyces sp.]